MAASPTYTGSFGKQEAERLLWRAGFGAREGEAEKLSKLGLTAAVHSLTRPTQPGSCWARTRMTRRVGQSIRST